MSLFGQPNNNTSSLFGQPATPAPSLFGNTSTATPSTGLFGTPTPAAGGGLFGAQQPAASKPTFSFGAPASTPAPSGGLFGQAPAATSAPTFSFGAAAPASAQSGGLFGQPAGGGGLFGQTSAAPTSGALFGQSASAAAGGLFGQASTAQQPLGGGGLFGGFGASKPLFGAPAPAAAQPQASGFGQPAIAQPASTISKQSKLKDLPDAARTVIEQIDASIRAQVQVAEELKSRGLGIEITKTTDLYNQYLAESTAVSNLLSEDSRATTDLRQRLEVDLSDLAKITVIIEGFKNPQVKGAAAKAVANFPFEYFSRKADEFRERITRYSSTMDQIQQQVESSHGLERNPAAIIPTLRAQHSSFMSLASSIATLNNDLKELKDDFRLVWREKTGSVQDPFRRAGVTVNGVENGIGNMDIR